MSNPSSTNAVALATNETFAGSVYWVPIDKLSLRERNPRTHSKRQIQQLAAAIDCFGFIDPVIIDEKGNVLAGHARIEATRLLGEHEVPALRVDHLNEAEKKAYSLAANRIAELAGWDKAALKLEFGDILTLDQTFDLELTGFATAEIDAINETIDGEPHADAADQAAVEPQGPQISQTGDLWQLGSHLLLCGDALDPKAYAALLARNKAQMVFTDPPYNVPIHGHVCGSGKVRHREFPMASGEMSQDQFRGFLNTALSHMAEHTIPGSVHFVCMDWRHLDDLLAVGRSAYTELKNICVWVKPNGGMGSFYRSQHEMVTVFISGNGKPINNFGLGATGRYRTNVWEYAGVNSLDPKRRQDLLLHPTVKPISLVADAIRDCSRRGGSILDPFGGSGTTLLAAERTGRAARLIEMDGLYVDVSIRRWQGLTGGQAIHLASGRHFDDIAAERASLSSTADTVAGGQQ